MRKTNAGSLPKSGRPLYQALLDVNLSFDRIGESLDTLRNLHLFRNRSGRSFFPAFDAAISEARAWFNTELLEAQGEVESRDWARLDLARARREKRFRVADEKLRRARKPGSATKKVKL
jgi:hypothetical protein